MTKRSLLEGESGGMGVEGLRTGYQSENFHGNRVSCPIYGLGVPVFTRVASHPAGPAGGTTIPKLLGVSSQESLI